MVSMKSDGAAILLIVIGALVSIALLIVIADANVQTTSTYTTVNETVTAPAVNGTLDLTGRDYLSGAIVCNVTNMSICNITGSGGGGFEIVDGLSSTTGLKTVKLTLNDTGPLYAGQSVNVSYTYNPDGYIDSSGGRSITLLITLFSALGILIFVIAIAYKRGSLENIVKRG